MMEIMKKGKEREAEEEETVYNDFISAQKTK